jgi:hypothetical protein
MMSRPQFSLKTMLSLMVGAALIMPVPLCIAPLVGLNTVEAIVVGVVAILLFGSKIPQILR